jgi:acetyl-CoA C-acetyltransferase
MGFAEPGKAKDLVYEKISLKGEIPVNPSGGLKAKGNPLGATGVGQIVEAYRQLMGKAGERQIKGADRALVHNMGGTGSNSVVHILGGE